MHIQQSKHHEYGQVVGEDFRTEDQVLEDLSAGLVRRTAVETASMATDYIATRVVPEHTRSEH